MERGISKEWTDAIYMPVGDDIMAVTPSEIAISIAAEMIRCRANFRPEKPHQKRSSSTENAWCGAAGRGTFRPQMVWCIGLFQRSMLEKSVI